MRQLMAFFILNSPLLALAQFITGNPIQPHPQPSPPPLIKKDNSLASVIRGSGIKQTKPGFYILACPAPSELVKNTTSNEWELAPYWKSYQTSLSEKIGAFLGAQWSGAAVGNIICLYQPGDTTDFPIQLNFSPLVNQPKSQNWKRMETESQLPSFNCTSNDPKDCLFEIKIKKHNTESLLEQAEKLYHEP